MPTDPNIPLSAMSGDGHGSGGRRVSSRRARKGFRLIWKYCLKSHSGCPRSIAAGVFLAWAVLFAGCVAGFAQATEEEEESGLRIDDVQFEDEHGDVRYSLITDAGTDVVMSFWVDGFERVRVEQPGEIPEERVHLQYEAELRDPQGVLMAPGESGEVDTILGPRDADWGPRIRWAASLPSYALPGIYRVQLHVKDVQSGEETTGSVPVRVRGERVQVEALLGVQQLEYANTRGGPWFPRRFFAPQRPIHVRYKVAGFQVSPDNEIWVEQDWTVLDADGNEIVSQQNVIVDHETYFYPPRFLQAVLELGLEDPQPGTYTFRIAIRDRIGGQSVSTNSEFFVRP